MTVSNHIFLGIAFYSPFYDWISQLLETVFQFGVIPVVSIGNHGNMIPYSAGFSSISPNVVSVGSTDHPLDRYFVTSPATMASYSARGPGINNQIKPDIVAPSGLRLAAAGTGSAVYRSITGTSFSAPIVAGGLALLKERCPFCSPFALKSILMNNVNQNVRYQKFQREGAPLSLMGAGELDVASSLKAFGWAYSIEDAQPSISFGLIEAAASETILRRTIRIQSLSSTANHTLNARYEFRKGDEGNALTIEIKQQSRVLPAMSTYECSSDFTNRSSNEFDEQFFFLVDVLFRIDASKVPSNHMSSTGMNRDNALETLDKHEVSALQSK